MSSYHLGDILPAALTTTPWEVELAKAMYAETSDSALKSIFGAQGWNVGLIDTLNKLSKDTLLPDADRNLYMTSNANVSAAVVNSFNAHLAEYEGQNVKEGAGAAIEKILEAGETTISSVASTTKMLPVVLALLAAGVFGYLIYAGKKGTKLTPF